MATAALLAARFTSWCKARRCLSRRILRGEELVMLDGRCYHRRCAPRGTKLDDKRPAAPVTDGRWEARRDLE